VKSKFVCFYLVRRKVLADVSSPECRTKLCIKIATRSFKIVPRLKYSAKTVTDINLINEEIRNRLNSGNACYHSVQNLWSSHLQSEHVKVKIYKIIDNFACRFVWV
jgi:hypothetical protein